MNRWKFKGEKARQRIMVGHTFQASNSIQEQQFYSIQLSFATEQLDKLYKFFKFNTLSISISPKGNSALFSVSHSRAWIVDSGASDHMTGNSTSFSSYHLCAGNHKIKIADGSFSAVAGKSSVVLSANPTLKDALHVSLAQDRNCHIYIYIWILLMHMHLKVYLTTF
jgi:hypothetical protein